MEITQQKEKQIKKREPLKGPAKQHQGCQGSHYNGSRKRREREKSKKCINENVPNLKKEAYPGKANDLKTTIDLEKTG